MSVAFNIYRWCPRSHCRVCVVNDYATPCSWIKKNIGQGWVFLQQQKISKISLYRSVPAINLVRALKWPLAKKIIFWHPLQYKLIKAVYKFLFYKYFSIPEPIAVNDIVLKFRFWWSFLVKFYITVYTLFNLEDLSLGCSICNWKSYLQNHRRRIYTIYTEEKAKVVAAS